MASASPPAGPRSPSRRAARRGRCLGLAVALGAAIGVLVLTAGSARAEEALVLDNGAILRGNVLRDDGTSLVLRLSGVGSDAKVTIDRRRVVQRFVTVEPGVRLAADAPREAVASDVETPRDPLPTTGPKPAAPLAKVAPLATSYVTPPPLPEEEPRAAEETFLRRAARRAELALPQSAGPRAFLVVAGLLASICLVGLATKMADLPFAGLGRTTLLAVLYCALLTVAWVFSDTFARADRTAVLVPTLLVAWMGVAAAVLRCGLLQAFHLLAFVLVSSALVVFASAVVLVSV